MIKELVNKDIRRLTDAYISCYDKLPSEKVLDRWRTASTKYHQSVKNSDNIMENYKC